MNIGIMLSAIVRYHIGDSKRIILGSSENLFPRSIETDTTHTIIMASILANYT